MITPMDLQNRKFEKGMLGYKKTDVDDFMACIMPEYEQLYKQSIEFGEKLSEAEKKIQSYKSMEDTMKNTLIMAQNTAEDVQKTAREKADLIIAEANAAAKKIIDEAEAKAQKITADTAEAKNAMNMFIQQSVGMMNAQIDTLKKFGI